MGLDITIEFVKQTFFKGYGELSQHFYIVAS
jgi:hypothetical protein